MKAYLQPPQAYKRLINNEIYGCIDIHHAVKFYNPVGSIIRDISLDDKEVNVIDFIFAPCSRTEKDDLLWLIFLRI